MNNTLLLLMIIILGFYADALADYEYYAELSGEFELYMEEQIAAMQAVLGE